MLPGDGMIHQLWISTRSGMKYKVTGKPKEDRRNPEEANSIFWLRWNIITKLKTKWQTPCR